MLSGVDSDPFLREINGNLSWMTKQNRDCLSVKEQKGNIAIFFSAVNIHRILTNTLCLLLICIALGFSGRHSPRLICHQGNQRLVETLTVFLERMLSVTVCFPHIIGRRVAK